MRSSGGIGRHAGLVDKLSALWEIKGVEPLKFGETFKMATPSQASTEEGVETRREVPKFF